MVIRIGNKNMDLEDVVEQKLNEINDLAWYDDLEDGTELIPPCCGLIQQKS
jgi:hypothetical protein